MTNRPSPPPRGVLPALGKSQRFPLGKTFITPAARTLLQRAGLPPVVLLAMHAQGEWGALDAHDRAANEQAVADGSRILSRYEVLPPAAVWVITEAANDGGQRPSTTILLPEEY